MQKCGSAEALSVPGVDGENSSLDTPGKPILSRSASKLEATYQKSNSHDGLILNYKDLTVGKELGRGGFGVVFKGSLHCSPVAIKQLHFAVSNDDEFYHEIDVMRRVRHPNVVLFLGATVSPDPLCIVTEFVGRGSFAGILHDKTQVIEKKDILKYAKHIARGMNYLHHSGIIHLDLKPDNVLVTENYDCKVSDFGLSKISESYASSVTNKGGGTVVYTAPEVYRGERITNQVDIFSFGIIAWEMYYRKKPYDGMNMHAICFKTVSENYRPPIIESDKPFYEEMMTTCWDPDPLVRPTFDQLILLIEELEEQELKLLEKKKEELNSNRSVSPSLSVQSHTASDATNGEDVNTWGEERVIKWLNDIGMSFSVEFFKGQNINGVVLKTLTNTDLQGLGIENFGLRRRLELAIQELTKDGFLSATSLESRSEVSSVEALPMIDADKYQGGHACNKVTPFKESSDDDPPLCTFCSDEFEEYEVGWQCQTCNNIYHDICFEDIPACESPSAQPTAKLPVGASATVPAVIVALEESPTNSPNPTLSKHMSGSMMSTHSSTLSNGSFHKRRRTVSVHTHKESHKSSFRPAMLFPEFSASALAHLTGTMIQTKDTSNIDNVKRLFKQGVDFKLTTRRDDQNFEEFIISAIRIARSECRLFYVSESYDECYSTAAETAMDIISSCQLALDPDKNPHEGGTYEEQDEMMQLAKNIRDQLQSTYNRAGASNIDLLKRCEIYQNSFTSMVQYLALRTAKATSGTATTRRSSLQVGPKY